MRKTGRLKSTPPVKPVKSIQVPMKVTKKKILLIAVLLAVGIGLIVWALVNFLTVPKGWQNIEAPSGLENTCVYDFSLQYLLGETEEKTNREKNAVTELYVKAAGDAYRIFSEEEIKDVKNIYYINHNPGQTVTVDPALYEAFSLLMNAENQALYLGPIYENNRGILSSEDDAQAEQYHPATDAETKKMYGKVLNYIANPNHSNHITLNLLGENQVRLDVSEEYQKFAKDNGFSSFISLDWMRNAFVADYIADALTEKGYCNGILTSYDGYVRNLDLSGRQYAFQVCNGSGNNRIANMLYSRVGAMIWMRNYPISLEEKYDYYYWDDGRVSHTRLDPADGMPKAACSDFVVYSRSLGCAQILVESMDVYISDTLDWAKAEKLPAAGVEFALVADKTLYASDHKVTFEDLQYGEPQYVLPGGK